MKDYAKLKQQADRRRVALKKGGCSTYTLDENEPVSICCLCCGMISYYTRDIQARYCVFCTQLHSEEKEAK